MIFITLTYVLAHAHVSLEDLQGVSKSSQLLPPLICNFYALHKRPLSNMETNDCLMVQCFREPHDFGNFCILICSCLFKNGTIDGIQIRHLMKSLLVHSFLDVVNKTMLTKFLQNFNETNFIS